MTCEFSPSSHFEVTRSDGTQATAPSALADGDRLLLRQGCVELKVDSAVRMVVSAPAKLVRRSRSSLEMEEGTAWFHVQPDGVGFRVKTPDLEVVDLGTEFGISARKGHPHEVHVLQGKVRAAAGNVTETLRAGDVRSVDPTGHLARITDRDKTFIKHLPDGLPYLHWSFDELNHNQLLAQGNFPTVRGIRTTFHPASPGAHLVPGVSGSALSFDGSGDYATADWAGLAGDRPRTVSAWVRLEPDPSRYYKQFSGIVGWGNEVNLNFNYKWKVLAVQEEHGGPAALRVSWGFAWLDGTTNLADGQWHHVVVATHGGNTPDGHPTAELYVDGVREKTVYGSKFKSSDFRKVNTDTVSPHAMPLVIGSDLNPDVTKRIHFRGEIDELKIFDGYLPAVEVEKLTHLEPTAH